MKQANLVQVSGIFSIVLSDFTYFKSFNFELGQRKMKKLYSGEQEAFITKMLT